MSYSEQCDAILDRILNSPQHTAENFGRYANFYDFLRRNGSEPDRIGDATEYGISLYVFSNCHYIVYGDFVFTAYGFWAEWVYDKLIERVKSQETITIWHRD